MTNSVLSQMALPPVKIGLPQWQHPKWRENWFSNAASSSDALSLYATQCNTIEGNTTFYHLPSPQTVSKWDSATPSDFRFTFKFNQQISHQQQLQHCQEEVTQQLNLLSSLGSKLGIMLLQLPASFGPRNLATLAAFCRALPAEFTYGVEVRHLAFFAKGEEEKQLNQLLMELGINRIIMDTRALFTGPAQSELINEVRTKKPRVPVNVIATGSKPVLRFVGNDNVQDNEACLLPWIKKCHQWRLDGLTPYCFFHRPDNYDAPWLANQFIHLYNATYPQSTLPTMHFSTTQQQTTLF